MDVVDLVILGADDDEVAGDRRGEAQEVPGHAVGGRQLGLAEDQGVDDERVGRVSIVDGDRDAPVVDVHLSLHGLAAGVLDRQVGVMEDRCPARVDEGNRGSVLVKAWAEVAGDPKLQRWPSVGP